MVEITDSVVRTSDKVGISVRGSTFTIKESVVAENGSGGILLAASRAEIQQNNLSNNGEWELKLQEDPGQVEAKKNWWGAKDSGKIRVVGPVEIEPVLKEPVDVRVLEKGD
jgi:hypothetical protein